MTLSHRFVSPPREELGRLRQPLTPGERLVFDFFDRNLALEWEIYIQPHLNGLRPDFVLLNRNVGIAVFEVKDWDLDAMDYRVECKNGFGPTLSARKDGISFSRESDNPVKKISQYKDEIFNLYCPRLKQKFGFALITSGIIFPFADDVRVQALLAPCLTHRGMDKWPAYNPVSGRNALRNNDIKAVTADKQL